MSAQPGGSILLAYRTQPAQAQAGGAVVLDTQPAATTGGAIRTACVVPWSASRASSSRTSAVVPASVRRDDAKRLPWAPGAPLGAESVAPWGVATATDAAAPALWGEYAQHPATAAALPWGVASKADRGAVLPWGRYAGRPAASASPSWRLAYKADDALVLPWGTYRQAARDLVAVVRPAVPHSPRWNVPWVRFSRPLNPGWGIAVPPNEPPTNEAGTVVVPSLRSYIVLNNVSLVRVSNSLPIPALSLSISIDADSWGWGWSASVPASKLDDLLPSAPGAPIELEAQINGVVWRLFAERIARDRRHGSDRLSVSGRGIAAELSAPLYPEESRNNTAGALTSQQLADAALTVNGVSLGWTLDWQIADWLVPAGAWVHVGTPIDAVARIASAAGGYVQADPVLRTLHVKKRYPVLPWNFGTATPDFILPSSATTREATQYVEKPDYNVVYVAGGAIGGVLGQVKRTGSAGDLPAEMQVDPLVTHADAARGRGESILGDTGVQQILTMETPVLEAIGIYPVGSLIEWQEGASARRGLVRSVSISAALPRVRQTIEVECHG